PVPGASTGVGANLVSSIFVVVFGFLFVTVSSRICGLIGTSANPVSGMTIATLMATCAMFLLAGWTGPAYSALALTIGGVVCIAAANAGATSQDLKTGYLVGATPSSQQIALIIGVMVSVFVIGGTLMLMNVGLQRFEKKQLAIDITNLPDGVTIEKDQYTYEGKDYILLNSFASSKVAQGKYLYNPQTGQVEVEWKTGIGGDQAAAPQANLMATVIHGILNQKLPWRLVLLGVFLVIAIELLGIRSLSFAVGSYLSIATTMAIFTGGLVRWLAERGREAKSGHAESEVSPGSLYASGLIAAGGVIGLLAIVINVLGDPHLGIRLIPDGVLRVGPRLLGDWATGNFLGIAMFLLLAFSLFRFARKKMD
ncbi:MAG: OPT/YSL family transporter, partial [Candidatus Acidiferrales bacterium]